MSAHASMNRIFRLVWNETVQAWVAVSEKARARGKRSASALALVAPLMATAALLPPAQAGPPLPQQLPTGGLVTAGTAAIVASADPASAVLNINQTTQRASISWETFNLGSAAQVNFNQPGSNSATLNRVLDSNPSQIMGKITANGQVFLSNPNGVYFGKTASVDVGALTATTHTISDADFMAGKTTFTRNGAGGSVVNEGTLRAALGGYIALLAAEVRNEGVIIARLGSVAMAAGETFTLNIEGSGSLAGISVTASAIRGLVENRGAVLAPGGYIVLSARSLDRLQGAVVKNTGRLEATGLAMKGGRIVLEAGDRIENSGVISANGGADGSPAGSISLTAPAIVNSGSISAAGAAAALPAGAGGSIALHAQGIVQTAGASIDVSGTGAGGGTVALQASGDVSVSGSVAADGGSGQGGSVAVTAGHNVTLQDASLTVSGDAGGGAISVAGGGQAPGLPPAPNDRPTVALLGATQLRSSSRRGKGGSISLSADRVGLFGDSALDASGASGGGAVRVGGGLHGADAGIANASQVSVGSHASIDASATEVGAGGTVVVWADGQSAFHGSIAARGGAGGGDGGQVEVSGKGNLLFAGTVDASAAAGKGGKAGSLLLDPLNLTIDAASGAPAALADVNEFTDNPGADSTITPATITAQTNLGTKVVLQANNDIVVNASIVSDNPSGTGGELVFNAGHSITLNGSVISDGGAITFTVNDSGANGALRDSSPASFTNYGLIDARGGAVSISMDSGGVSGAISAGQVTAGSYVIAHHGSSGSAASGRIDLGGTTISGNMTITSSQPRDIVNLFGNVVAQDLTTINVGTGDVTINRSTSDFNTINVVAGNVSIADNNALLISGHTAGSLTVATRGPIANSAALLVDGAASFTAVSGGFSNSDPYINLGNAGNDFQGAVTLSINSGGQLNTGGYAIITDANALTIASANINKGLTVSAANAISTGSMVVGNDLNMTSSTSGAISLGDVTTSSGSANVSGKGAISVASATIHGSLSLSGQGAVALGTGGSLAIDGNLTVNTVGAIAGSNNIIVGSYTQLTAGAGNDITLDSAGNNFNRVQIVSAKNATLVDSNAIMFGRDDATYRSTIAGNLAVTAGGSIASYRNNEDVAPLSVGGTATFTVTAANSDLLLGPNLDTYISNNGYQGPANSFSGTVTTATSGAGSFRDVSLRNTSAAAGLITGLTNGLNNVVFYYDNASSLTLPALTVNGNLLVQVPQGSISQSGALVVNNSADAKGQSTFGTSAGGDITLTNAGNDFNHIEINRARDVSIVDVNTIDLYSNQSYFNVSRNFTVTAGGSISDSSIGNNTGYYMNIGSAGSGVASFSVPAGSDVILDNGQNAWQTVTLLAGRNFTLNPRNNVVLGNVNATGTVSLSSGFGGSLTQLPATAVLADPASTTTFGNFYNGINLPQSGNVLGNLAISNAGDVSIRENDAVTQAAPWNFNGTNGGNASTRRAVTIATSNEQAIALDQVGNVFGDLTITQYNAGATSFGAVTVRETADSYYGMSQGSAWTVHGATTVDGGAYSVILNNVGNSFGPLQVLAASGLTNSLPSSVIVYARANGSGDAISDVGAAGAWSAGNLAGNSVKLLAFDSSGVSGAGNITLANPANLLGDLYVRAAAVSITEAGSITDGAALGPWNSAGDIGWNTSGITSLNVVNPTGKSISFANLSNKLGALNLSTSGAAGTLSSVLLTDNADLTQASAWLLGSAPVTLDARTNRIILTNSNVLGLVAVNSSNGTPASLALTENDAIEQGSLWNLPGATVKLVAENAKDVRLGGFDNVLGNVAISGANVALRENANIVQDGSSAGDWHTTGTTALSIAAGHNHNYLINLRNAGNTFGALSLLGVADGASYAESAAIAATGNITQASPWRLQLSGAGVDTVYTPVTLNASGDVLLTQPDNQIGRLTISAQNATIVANKSIDDAGIGWRVPGVTTLTARNSASPTARYDISLVYADNDFGAVTVVAGNNVKITDKNAIDIAGAAVDPVTGLLTITAGSAITQSAPLSGNGILLSGTGSASLNGPNNYIDNVAANFTGGDLVYTGAGDYAVSSSSVISIGAHKVSLTSTGGAVSQLLRVSASSAALEVNSHTALSVPNTVSIAGAQTYTSDGGITLSGSMTSTAAGAITFNSPVTLGAAMQINNTSAGTSTPVIFNSTVAGAGYTLGINTRGAVDFYDTVSNVGAAGTTTLLLQGSGATTFHKTLSTNDGISVAGPLVLQDNVILGHGAQASIFGGAVTLGKLGGMNISGYNNLSFNGGLQLQSGASTITSHDSTITLAGAVSGPYALTLDAGAQNIIGISNIGADISSLNATAGTIIVPGSFSIAGPQTYNATSITVGGTLASTAPGAITFNSPLTLAAASTINTVNSDIVFGGIVNGSYKLSANAGSGSVAFNGAVGHIARLGTTSGAALDINAAAVHFGSTLETNSGINLNGASSFAGDVSLGDGSSGSTLAGRATMGGITFSGYDGVAFNGGLSLTGDTTVRSNGSLTAFGAGVDGAHALTVNALATPAGNAGSVSGLEYLDAALTGLTVNAYTLALPQAGFAVSGPMQFTAAGGITVNGNVGNTSSTGQIDFNSPLTLATGPARIASHDGIINFADTVSGAQNLTVNGGSGAVNFSKTVSNIGSGVGAAVTLAGSGVTTFAAALSANSGLLASGGGNLVLQNDASFASGDVSSGFGSDFGTGTLTVGRSGATSTLSGYRGLTFRGAVVLTGGAVAINSHDSDINVQGGLNGAYNLVVNAGSGATSFGAALGAATPVGSGAGYALDLLSSGATSFAATVATASGIRAQGALAFGGDVSVGNGSVGSTFASAVTLHGPATGALSFNARNGISFGAALNLDGGAAAINSNNAPLAFTGAINGAAALAVSAGSSTVVFGSAIGAVTPLTSFDVSAASITLPAVTTSGNQTYAAGLNAGGDITLNGNLRTQGAGNLSVSGATSLSGDTRITTGGSITFNTAKSTIDGAHNLVIEAGSGGNVVLGGQLGLTTALADIGVTGNNLSLPNINASGLQSYTAQHDITLVQSRTAGNDVTFSAGAAGDGSGALILPSGISLNVTNHALSISAADLQMNGSSSISTGSGLLTISGVNNNDIYLGGTPAAVAGRMHISGDELQRISTSGGLLLSTSGSGTISVDGVSQAQSQNVSGPLQLKTEGSGAINFTNAASTFNAISTQAASGLTNVGVNLSTTNDAIDFKSPVAVAGASTINSGGGDITFRSTVAVDNDLTLSTANGVLSFGGAVGSNKTLTLNLGGGSVTGLGQLQSALTGLTVNSSSGITLPAFTIAGPQVYNTGIVTTTGNLGGVGISFNNLVDVQPASGSALTFNAGSGVLNFGNLVSFNANAINLTADEINFARAVTGAGSLLLQPASAGRNVAVNGSGAPITGLNLTAAEMSLLPIGTLTSLTIGSASGSGSLDLAGPLSFAARPLTLNGGGGISQSAAITSGELTVFAAGHPITLANAGNNFGAVAIHGTPSAVSLRNTGDIVQQGSSAWNLGSATLTLNAGSHDISLLNAGNTFGSMALTAHAVRANVTGAADFAASSVDSLALVASGAVSTSGKLAVTGLADIATRNDAGAAIVLDQASTVGSITARSRNGAGTAVSSGNIVLAPGASTLLGQLETTGNITLTAANATTLSEDGASVLHASGLELLGGGSHLLNLGDNAFHHLAGNTGNVSLTANSDYEIGVVNASAGLAVSGVTTLSSTAVVTQSRLLTTPALELLGTGGTFILDDVGNNIASVAGNTGSVALSASGGVDIGTVHTAGLTTTGDVTLRSSGTVSQSQKIAASGLELLGTGGNFVLTNSANAITTLAGNTGSVAVRENSGFDIGSVGASSGLQVSDAVRLDSSAAVTASQALTAPRLELSGVGGNYTLEHGGNAVGTLAGNTGSVRLLDNAGLNIGTVDSNGLRTSGTLTLSSSGAVTQSSPLHAAGLELLGTGGNFTLADHANSVTTVAGNTGNVSFAAGAGFVIGTVNTVGLHTSAKLVLGTDASVTQSAAISAAGLDLQGASGHYLLTDSGNAIGTLAGNTASASVLDNSGLVVGSVGASHGISTSANLSLSSSAAVTQTAPITAAGLELLGGGSVVLNDGGNRIDTLAGHTGDVRVTVNGGAAIGSVNGSVGLASSGDIHLSSDGTVTQSQKLTASGLELSGHAFVLDHAANSVLTVAGSADAVRLAGGSFDIGTVGVSGLQVAGALSLSTSGSVSQSQPISAAGLELLGAGGNFVLTNGANVLPVLAGNSGNVRLSTGGALEIGTVGSAGMHTSGNLLLKTGGLISQLQGLDVGGDLGLETTHAAGDVSIANSIDSVLGATSVGGNYQLSAPGKAVIQRANSDVQVRDTLNINAASLVMGSAGNIVGGSTITPTVAELRQSGVIVLGNIEEGGNYSVVSLASNKSYSQAPVHGDAIVLADASNRIGGAIAISTSGPTVNVGAAGQTGISQAPGSTIHIGGTASFTAEHSSVNGSGAIALNNAGNSFGSLVLSGDNVAVSVAGAASIGSAAASSRLVLNASGALSQSGPVVTPQLAITAGGAVTLTHADNDVAQLAIHAGGAISYRDSNSVAIASVAGVIGLHAGPASSATLVAGGDITQGSAIDAAQFSASAGGSVLLAGSNAIDTLGVISAAGAIDVNDASGNLHIGGNLASSGATISVRSAGDLVLENGRTVATSGSGNIYLAAGSGANFINGWSDVSVNPLTVGSGRYLIYSSSNVATVLGGIHANSYQGVTFSDAGALNMAGTDNRVLYSDVATLRFTATSQSRVYGALNPVLTYTVTGLLTGDEASSVFSGMPALSTLLNQDSHVGTGSITIGAGNLVSLKGYAFDFVNGVLTIDARPVSLSGSRVYDGSAAAGAAMFSMSNLYNGQSLVLGGSGVIADKNVGSGKTVAIGSLSLADGSGSASDYTLVGGVHSADISRATVTLAAGKVYDGSTALAGAVSIGTGVVGETLAYSGALASDANVATAGKSISAITLADATGLASNYQLPALDAAHAALTITAKTVALAASKTYDGSSSLTAAVNITTGVAGELLAYSGAVASDANVAVAGKTISAITLLDSATARASNYALPALAAAPVTINPKTVALAASKTYDGSTSLGGAVSIDSGIIGQALLYSGAVA
ncbi:filamentous hemagglutinin N-terminal domain-containing protein, partial [Massilia sp. PWRC2]|uniref:filamentous hemagglutinin N-terminal domain-containing protein n=1 Tax=Massilia sp. PWRC2 TaxID=2804626 RepID=UPI003CE7BE8C